MKKLITVFLTSIIVFISGVAFADEINLQSGVMMPVARDLKPFTLQNTNSGQNFTNAHLKDRWTLLFFGFTNCPALCPTTMAQLNNAYVMLQSKKFDPMPQVLFVSVDPDRDNADKVKVFATTFNKNFIGLRTDDMATLEQMTHEMNSMFVKVNLTTDNHDKDNKADYTIDHTGDIMVINPKGQLAAMLTMPHQANDIVADYETVIKASKPKGWLW